jgi:hypothetical protein
MDWMSQINLFSAGGGLAGKSSVPFNCKTPSRNRPFAANKQKPRPSRSQRPRTEAKDRDNDKGRAPPCPERTFGFTVAKALASLGLSSIWRRSCGTFDAGNAMQENR